MDVLDGLLDINVREEVLQLLTHVLLAALALPLLGFQLQRLQLVVDQLLAQDLEAQQLTCVETELLKVASNAMMETQWIMTDALQLARSPMDTWEESTEQT